MTLDMVTGSILAVGTFGMAPGKLGASTPLKATGQTTQLAADMQHDVGWFVSTRAKTNAAVVETLIKWSQQV